LPEIAAAWLLFAVVALAPLPFGSDQSVDVAFWCIVLGSCLALAAVVRPLRRFELTLFGLAGIAIASYALVLHEQLTEHPWFWGAIPHPIWREAEAALDSPLVPSVSIARNQAWFELGRPLVCVLAICCGFLIGANDGRARQLIKVIAWSGAVYAAYGILEYLIDPTHILWREREAYLGSVTGPFINRNTAAAYFGSCAVLWSLLFWERARLELPPGAFDWRDMSDRSLSAPSKKAVIAFSMFFLCLAALFMTGSRGGVVVSLLALVIAFAAFFRRNLPGRAGLAIALLGGGAFAVVLLQFMGGDVNARFDAQGFGGEGRLGTYKATLRIIADHPWFGTGLGTFAHAFPAYRDPNESVWGVWDMTHNTLLQIAAEMGVPIAGLVVLAWLVIFAVLCRGTLVRTGGLIAPVAALAVALLAVMHSLIDFSLQIPGYAIVALSLIGVGLAQSFRRRKAHL
jgi:O-antigen ligase